MAGLTLSDAEAQLALYLTAEQKVLTGQEYTIGSRRLKRADLAEIRNGISYWQAKVQQFSNGGPGIRVRGLTPG